MARYLLLEVISYLSNRLAPESFDSIPVFRCLFARTLSLSIVLLYCIHFYVLIWITVVACHDVFILKRRQFWFVLHLVIEQINQKLLCLSVDNMDVIKNEVLKLVIISLGNFCPFFDWFEMLLLPGHYWDHMAFEKQLVRLELGIWLFSVLHATSATFPDLLNDVNFNRILLFLNFIT